MNEKELPQLSQRAYNALLKIYGHKWHQTAHEVEAAPMDRLEDLLEEIADRESDYTVLLGSLLGGICKPGAIRRHNEKRAKRDRQKRKQQEQRVA